MTIKQFIVNPFAESTYIVWDETTREAAIIDPGMMVDCERKQIDDYVEQNQLKLGKVLCTHFHIDHCAGVEHVTEQYGAEVYGSERDVLLIQYLPMQAEMFGLPIKVKEPKISVPVSAGCEVKVGELTFKVLETPGHSEGGVTYYCAEQGLAFVGDTIFMGSVGRTDLPGGNFTALVDSIKHQLFELPEETKLLCGHGESTSVGREKVANPYVQ